MNDIVLKNISKIFPDEYGATDVLKDISVDIGKKSFVSIVGYSGCGKTTLLNIIGGLLKPTSGSVLIGGEPTEAVLRRHRLGFIFQEDSLLPWRSVYDNVKLSAEITGINNNFEKINAVINVVGLSDFVHFFPCQLSGGMKARASIARALLIEPSILLIDEAFSHLDDITRQNMNSFLLDMWSRTDATAVFVTHNISEAVFMSDRVIILDERPAMIKHVVDINLPRPRDNSLRFEGAFIDKVKEVQKFLIKAS